VFLPKAKMLFANLKFVFVIFSFLSFWMSQECSSNLIAEFALVTPPIRPQLKVIMIQVLTIVRAFVEVLKTR
jgi:hypothetical protein